MLNLACRNPAKVPLNLCAPTIIMLPMPLYATQIVLILYFIFTTIFKTLQEILGLYPLGMSSVCLVVIAALFTKPPTDKEGTLRHFSVTKREKTSMLLVNMAWLAGDLILNQIRIRAF